MKLSEEQWYHFVVDADTYNGDLSIGELFCKTFNVKDRELILADVDTVWQIIVNKYR